MIALHSRGEAHGFDAPIVGVIRWLEPGRTVGVFRSREEALGECSAPWATVRTPRSAPPDRASGSVPHVVVGEEIQPLANGDIVALQPSGRVDTLFRGGSDHNSLFITEQCNSYCVMCSQPPRRVDDLEHYLALNVRTVRLMPRDVRILGLTGGEPTLLGARLADLLRVCRTALPSTQLDILSNGRRLSSWGFARTIAAATDNRILFTIPLYADNAPRHDYIVQAKGAFRETLDGFLNLAAAGVRTEVRVVLHKQTVGRLVELARFIQKNLPFVEQVAFMGLEVTGLARANEELLWIEPPRYMDELRSAVEHLTALGVPTSLYNLPRCLVPEDLWPYLCLSISDWKRTYSGPCASCRERTECGGLFATSSRTSALLRAL